MVTNGYIWLGKALTEHHNRYGEVGSSSTLWSDPMRCLIAVREEQINDGDTNQLRTKMTATILVEGYDIDLNARWARLTLKGKDLGELAVTSIVPLTQARRMSIVATR